ncbi:bis(5'-nucleosyl)-tetraphosphatase (symmetrical) YqeK [Bacillus sp. RAR_GA_16]|uniref:bis(5'-nucleosyl)-tetraphosphatase (symmetrical) YqeK n=1 Tax=Bacillus sp. RAR_GA_16 TaxID=2876774 RepID=UPI001CCB26DA|nr:bis(5'-nucleosyl)-tetraphosphatase (symmetrical) YqeK [Bacillus sp. RAR_GA_16]MCA0171796.1 bis(5'-nucleosyl)-tetraphosphatase (symmetrical) YqeK [Bacillus sp. RAR_GA_16]
MNRTEALKMVKPHLTEHRYVHTIGVTDTAVELAEKYGADPQRTEIAAVFHDYAKFRPKDEMRQIILEQSLKKDLLEYSPELWHAPVGAYLVRREIGIEDEEILNAIKYHTSGRPNMTLMEKCVFIADYIEPGRSFPGVDEVREVVQKDLDQAIALSLRNTVQFLMKKNQPVYPATFLTYNSIVNSLNA